MIMVGYLKETRAKCTNVRKNFQDNSTKIALREGMAHIEQTTNSAYATKSLIRQNRESRMLINVRIKLIR